MAGSAVADEPGPVPIGLRSGSTTTKLAAVTAGVVLAADQATKAWAVAVLADGRTIDLFWTFRLRLVHNYGSAFSLNAGRGPLLAVLGVVVSIVLLRAAARAPSVRTAVAYGAVVGGALGNVVDRVIRSDRGWLRGPVVDFLDPGWFPVFNLADSSIVVGVGVLLALSWRVPPGRGPGGGPNARAG